MEFKQDFINFNFEKKIYAKATLTKFGEKKIQYFYISNLLNFMTEKNL